MPLPSLGIGTGQGRDRGLDFVPEIGASESVLMLHGFEQRFNDAVSEADPEERPGPFWFQIQEHRRVRVILALGSQAFQEISQSRRTIRSGLKGNGAGVPDTLLPI